MRRRVAAAGVLALLVGTLAAGQEPSGGPRIRVEPDGFDFGRALPGKTLRKEFALRNFGDAELLVEKITTTCGCTAALLAERRIAPGGRVPLRVTLETRQDSGRVERRVLVRSNDPETPLVEVRLVVTVEPSEARRR